MTLPQNVADAVTELQRKAFAFDAMVAAGRISKNLEEQSLALSDGPIELQHAATINAHLLSQESRLAAANALIRDISFKSVEWKSFSDAVDCCNVISEATLKHLQGAGDE